jgi:hypothetical protein
MMATPSPEKSKKFFSGNFSGKLRNLWKFQQKLNFFLSEIWKPSGNPKILREKNPAD